jgi:anti-sigma factor RsiW
MKCSQVRDRWAALLDRALADAERESVERHLRDCRGCESEYQALLLAENLLQRHARSRLAAPAGMIDRVMQRVEAPSRPAVIREMMRLSAVAAALLLVLWGVVNHASYEPVVHEMNAKIEDTRHYVIEEIPRALTSGVSSLWKGSHE